MVGSRRVAARYGYTRNYTSTFVELKPGCTPNAQELYDWLESCESVVRVEWQTSKTSQGNVGRHESEQNIKVYPKAESAGYATHENLEFEITCYNHMSENTPCPYTVTVMFKEPPTGFVAEA